VNLETPLPNTFGRCLSRLLVVLTLLSLTACSTISTAGFQAPVTKPDESCLQMPQPLRPLTEKSLAAVVLKLDEVSDEYHVLAERHRCLVEFERAR
jgi:hypothetical protein